MNPVDQTTFGHPGGNCFSACVASLLELSIADVPYFMDEPADEWTKRLDAWLAPRGFYAVHFNVDPKYCDEEKAWPKGFYILNGKSPRGDHAVVAHGRETVHDPNPKRDGLVSIDGMTLLVPLFGADAAAAPQAADAKGAA